MCVGEAIVDLLPDRRGRLRDVEYFHKIPGGAPANVALGLARLGCASGLMGVLGDDEFGHFLDDALAREGVFTGAMEWTEEAATGFTFVALLPNGDRTFTAPRSTTADMMLHNGSLATDTMMCAEVLLFGTNQMIASPQRDIVLDAMARGRDHDRFIVVDPNIRSHLWSDPSEIVPTTMSALSCADIVKLNDEEIEILAQGSRAASFYHDILAPRGVVALVATRARGGAEVFCGDLHVTAPAPPVDVIDTTGAGDGFVAGILYALCTLAPSGCGAERMRAQVEALDHQVWSDVLSLGCFVGSHVCTTLGATTGLPLKRDIPEALLGALDGHIHVHAHSQKGFV